MVNFTPVFAAALFVSRFAAARPADSAINEPAVSAPNGTPITEATTSTASAATAVTTSADSVATSSAVAQSSAPSYGGSSWNSQPSYGSGSSNWGNSGYNDCVNQCIASYGAPAYKYQPTATSGSSGSTGTGATHTVIVAPSQGVLRYIPFALNASVGDTVKFMWGANNHTVTKGTQLTPCNRSNEAFFASGTQNKDFVFTQVINDTNPLYIYCATPGHCQKGMFGIINPPSALNNPTSVSAMIPSMVANNSDMAAMAAYSNKQCDGSKAANWGGNINLAEVPAWAQPLVVENTWYTRMVLAANPDLVNENGGVDMSATGSNPIMVPQDIRAALNNAAASPTGASSSTSQSSSSSASPAASQTASGAASQGKKNGASALASPRVLVGAVVAVATFFAL